MVKDSILSNALTDLQRSCTASLSNIWDKFRGQPAHTRSARATEVIARIEKFIEDFDLGKISHELDCANLKEGFADSVGTTAELLRALRLARWGDSNIKNGALRRTELVFGKLKDDFEREAGEFIKSHGQYPQLQAQYDKSTLGMDERHANFHKFAFKFEQDCSKLLDGTIAWHMRKFVRKVEEAFVGVRTTAEIRGCMCSAIDILDMGLRSHFPNTLSAKGCGTEQIQIDS